MEQRIGQIFSGVISGITSWGLYVELPDTVEGLVHVSKIEGDFFYYREDTYEMTGRDTGKAYRLGQKVNVIVDGVDYFTKIIDFVFVSEGDESDGEGRDEAGRE